MIKEAYVSFETAKLLKEKGFDEATYNFYHISDKFMRNQSREVGNLQKHNETEFFISAPTQQMAMKWLREVHKKFCDIRAEDGLFICNIIDIEEGDYGNFLGAPEHCVFDYYEEACESAIKYCLENILEA